jgi:hypothetical protein
MLSSSRHRILACLALACAASIALRAQEPPQFYPVRGVVLSSVTHQPIARVLVNGQSDAALTDGDGRFELNLPAGPADISVKRPGYAAGMQNQIHGLNVSAGMRELTFTLTPLASVTGHVTLSTGDDAGEIHFVQYRRYVESGHQTWRPGLTLTTNSEGIFRMPAINAPISMVLCSEPVQEQDQSEEQEQAPAAAHTRPKTGRVFGYPPVCFPGPIASSTGTSTANLLALTPGQQAEFEVTLTRQPFYLVTISVPNMPKGQIPTLEIHEENERVLEFSTTWNAQSGTAELYLPNGNYYADLQAQEPTPAYGRIGIQVASRPMPNITMVLHPLHPIPVVVRKNFTEVVKPPHADEQGDQAPANPVGLVLIPADMFADRRALNGSRSALGSDPSLLEIDDIAPGRYWVHAGVAQDVYVSSMTSGSIDLSREPLAVGTGSTVSPIQVTLRNDVGKLECTVASTSAGAESSSAWHGAAVVYAFPLSGGQPVSQGTELGGQAQTTFENLPPGDYRVAAFDHAQVIDMDDPQGLAKLMALGQSVTVSPGSTATVQLEVIQTGETGADYSGSEGITLD